MTTNQLLLLKPGDKVRCIKNVPGVMNVGQTAPVDCLEFGTIWGAKNCPYVFLIVGGKKWIVLADEIEKVK